MVNFVLDPVRFFRENLSKYQHLERLPLFVDQVGRANSLEKIESS
jgi:hypothetical protein